MLVGLVKVWVDRLRTMVYGELGKGDANGRSMLVLFKVRS